MADSESAGTGIARPASGLMPVRCTTCRGTNVGTEEALTGTALVTGYDQQTGEFAYTGETIVDYDSSTTQRSDDGRTIMFCRDCCCHFLFARPAPAPPAVGQVDKLSQEAQNQAGQPCKPDET